MTMTSNESSVMDKGLIKARFGRAASTYSHEATVQQRVAARLARMVSLHVPARWHRRVWEVGCGTGLFTEAYLREQTPGEMWLNDICPEMERCLAPLLSDRVHFAAADAEQTAPPQGASLIVSCSALQWFCDPMAFLRRCHEALPAGGCMAIATFGQDNLREVRCLTGTGLDYRTAAEWRSVLEEMGFRALRVDEEKIAMSFPTPVDVLKHLQRTGVTGIRRQAWTRERLETFARDYAHRFATSDGRVSLTYHPIYLIMEKK